MLLTKQIEKLASNNVRFCQTAPDEYILFQNKHIPQGDIALENKLDAIRKFAEKHHGECRATSAPYIRGDERRQTFYMFCDCIAAKAFDAVIEGRTS